MKYNKDLETLKFSVKAFVHPSQDHVGKGERVGWSVISYPNADCPRNSRYTEFMLLVIGSSL
jgi:hypothetical protein